MEQPRSREDGDQDGVDRRRTPRVDVNAEFEGAGGRTYVRSLSRHGVFLATRNVFPVGTELRVRFSLVGRDVYSIQARARVVHHQFSPLGMGLEFVDVDRAMMACIEEVIDAQLPIDSGPPIVLDDRV